MEENQNEQTAKATTNERKGFNITSMILGIISVIGICWWYISIPCSIIAIIFSIAGKNDAGRGMGVAGLVLGIIGLILCIALYGLVLLGVYSTADSLLSSGSGYY